MAKGCASFVLLLNLLFVMLGCNRAGETFSDEAAAALAPVGIVVDQEISGDILGQPLRGPVGLAVSADRAIYCVDRDNNRLLKFRQDLTPVREAGGAGSAAGLLNRPGYVAVDNQLNVFVAEEGNQRISRFNADLVFVDAIDFYDIDDPLKFGVPSGVAVNAHGEMWVGDRQRNRVVAFTNAGEFDRFIGEFGAQAGQVRSPESITLGPSGQFHVSDAGNNRVVVYDQYGSTVRTLANSAFTYPVASVPLRNASWVLDGSGGRVFFCTPFGEILYSAGPLLSGSSTPLRKPSDIVLLPDNRLLIADTGNNRLLVCRVLSGTE